MDSYRLKKYDGSIYLCGFMGTGKSSVGIQLAKALDQAFKDLDTEIIRKAELSIPEIFERQGEDVFRKLEWKTLYELTQNYKGVLSLGGGSLQSQNIVDHLKLYGLLIFIETPISEIVHRIGDDQNRPLLRNEDGSIKESAVLMQDLLALYEKRLPLYEQAQIKITTTDFSSIEEIVADLKERIARYV